MYHVVTWNEWQNSIKRFNGKIHFNHIRSKQEMKFSVCNLQLEMYFVFAPMKNQSIYWFQSIVWKQLPKRIENVVMQVSFLNVNLCEAIFLFWDFESLYFSIMEYSNLIHSQFSMIWFKQQCSVMQCDDNSIPPIKNCINI